MFIETSTQVFPSSPTVSSPPTCENLARFIAECVQEALGDAAHVSEVRVAEDETISATHRPDRDAASRG